MSGLNKNWKKGKYYKQRKFDSNFINMFTPWYAVSQLRGNCAIIINGRQLIIKQMPKNKDYFIDKELGMFEINPDKSFFLNKTAVYFYDVRNQNAIHPGLLNDLYTWATHQGLFKIRRVDVEHAKRLRNMEGSNLVTQMESTKKETRIFMAKVLKEIKKENEKTKDLQKQQTGTEEESEDYKMITEENERYLIVQNMFEHGYIDMKQSDNLNHKLKLRQITSTDDLLHELESFCDVYVTKPISHELERILDDFHTFKPRDIIGYIKDLSKIRKGLKQLRTKPIINWFPSMYILFGALGIGIIYVLYSQYGGDIELSGLLPGT